MVLFSLNCKILWQINTITKEENIWKNFFPFAKIRHKQKNIIRGSDFRVWRWLGEHCGWGFSCHRTWSTPYFTKAKGKQSVVSYVCNFSSFMVLCNCFFLFLSFFLFILESSLPSRIVFLWRKNQSLLFLSVWRDYSITGEKNLGEECSQLTSFPAFPSQRFL